MRRSLQVLLAAVFASVTVHGRIQDQDIVSSEHSTQQCDIQRLLADAPSLLLHVTLTNKKMHGQSVFDVIANPVVSPDHASVRYDAFTTLIDGDKKVTYLLVDGATYGVEEVDNDTAVDATRTVRCITSPVPFDSFVSALDEATRTASVNGEAPYCSGERAFKTSLGDQHFSLCSQDKMGFVIYSEDMTVAVEYMDSRMKKIPAPVLSNTSEACSSRPSFTRVTRTATRLLTGS